ncbi:MAG: alpha/beta hydrolase, partial [Eubacterium sp.]|nr:alpha/beta hydrolase [Eubacterium sp.]
MKKLIKIIFVILIALIVVLGLVTGVYLGGYYRAADVGEYLSDSDAVKVSEIKEGYFFDGEGKENALIFYPGANVEVTAYAPLMSTLAENGVDCFLIKMPMMLSLLGTEKAERIRNQYEYERYYLSGHSLGGLSAAECASKHTDNYSGLFLLASYPNTDLSGAEFPVVYIRGDRDGVINAERLKRGYALSPDGYREVIIEGGNHSG